MDCGSPRLCIEDVYALSDRNTPALEGVDLVVQADEILERGLSYIPEEGMRDGMIKDFSVSENLILREHDKPPFSRWGFLNFGDIARNAAQVINDFNAKTPSQETPAKSLSGGTLSSMTSARPAAPQAANKHPIHCSPFPPNVTLTTEKVLHA